MIRASSVLLLLAGAGLIAFGLYGAITALGGLYQGAMDAPLDQPETAEVDTADAMLRALMFGAAGVPALLLGRLFWRRDRARARHRRGMDA